EKRKTGCESEAMNAVLGSAMKIDNFLPMQACVSRDDFEIERELGFVTNRNLYERAFDPIRVNCIRFRKRFAKSLLDPSKNIFDRRARVDRADRIVKTADCGIGRRELNHAGNLCAFKRPLGREDFIKNVDRGVV